MMMHLIQLSKRLLILSCLYPLLCSALQDDNRRIDTISLSFHQAPISIILQALADHQQLNLILDLTHDNPQTVTLHNMDWHQALALITQKANLQYVHEKNVLSVSSKPDPKLLFELKQLQIKDAQLNQPLIFKPLRILHTDIQSLITMINQQQLLSERGRILTDTRTNTLIIHDIQQNIQTIESIVKQLDLPLPQIHISAHIVTMSQESATELGIKWGYVSESSQWVNKFNVDFGVANAPSVMGFNLAKRAGNLLNLELSALEAENQLEIIASPNLLTTHQQTASIKQGTDIPYEVASGNNGATSIEFKQAVLGLEVTPRIIKNNQIELTLYITQNTAGRSIKRRDGGEALAIDTQEIKTQVLVNNGETLILGGIFQQSQYQDQRHVPGIHQVPFLGRLFKYDGVKLQKRELVIFITPQLIRF